MQKCQILLCSKLILQNGDWLSQFIIPSINVLWKKSKKSFYLYSFFIAPTFLFPMCLCSCYITHKYTHIHAHTHTHAHMHTRADTCTQTHSHKRFLSVVFCTFSLSQKVFCFFIFVFSSLEQTMGGSRIWWKNNILLKNLFSWKSKVANFLELVSRVWFSVKVEKNVFSLSKCP